MLRKNVPAQLKSQSAKPKWFQPHRLVLALLISYKKYIFLLYLSLSQLVNH